MPSQDTTTRPEAASRRRPPPPATAPPSTALRAAVVPSTPAEGQPADALATLLARSVARRVAGEPPTQRTLARVGDQGFWILRLDGTYRWHSGTDATGFVSAGFTYKDPGSWRAMTGSWFAWPVYRTAPDAAFAGLIPGWDRARVIALAAAFALDGGGLTAPQWVGIARAGTVLRDHEADVATFARLPGWVPAGKLALATGYGAAVPPRPAAEWLEITTAISTPRVRPVDRAPAVATFAAIENGWTRPGRVGLAAAFGGDRGGQTAVGWAELAATHAMLRDQHEVVAALARAGWTAADVGTFAGELLTRRLTPGVIAELVGTAGMVAATLNMRSAWTPAELAAFVHGALRSLPAPAAYDRLAALMATPGLPATSHALIAHPWTTGEVGEFSAQALLASAGDATTLGATIQATLSAATVNDSLRAMVVAGWTNADLGSFVGASAVDARTLANLLSRPQFVAASRLMHTDGWSATAIGRFVTGALSSGLAPAGLAALAATTGFGAASHLWLAAGWSGQDVGTIVAKALEAGLLAPALVVFLRTADAPQSALGLRSPWSAAEIGKTVGHCLTRAGAPTASQMERLLFRAQTKINGRTIEPKPVRDAATANTCGAPAWADVIARIDTFQRHWRGPEGHRASSHDIWTVGSDGVDKIRFATQGKDISHVAQGHTFKHFVFSYANCTRSGVGVAGNCSFFLPAETDATDIVHGLRADPAVRTLAENAAKNAAATPRGTRATQGVAQGCTVGLRSDRPDPRFHMSNVSIGQVYPNAGTAIVTPIVGRDLVAIGRFFGLIT